MAQDIPINVFYPAAGSLPTVTTDASGSLYTAWELADSGTFQITVPSSYTVGTDLSLRLTEVAENESTNHKWACSVSLNSGTPATVAAEYASSSVTLERTTRAITLSTDGEIAGGSIAPMDTISVTLTRVVATSDEDPDPIRLYNVVARFETTTAILGYLGRVGKVIEGVAAQLNDMRLRTVESSTLLAYCNEVMDDLAAGGFWKKTGEWVLTDGDDSIDLYTEYPDLVELMTVYWTDSKKPLGEVGNHHDFLTASRQFRSGTSVAYFLDGSTLRIVPAYETSVDDTLSLYYTYRPTDLDLSINYDPPTPPHSDGLFHSWCMFRVCERDELDTGRPGQPKSGEYLQLYRAYRSKLMRSVAPKTRRVKGYR